MDNLVDNLTIGVKMDVGKALGILLEKIMRARIAFEEGELKNVVTMESVHHHNFIKGVHQGLRNAEEILLDYAKSIGLTRENIPNKPIPQNSEVSE